MSFETEGEAQMKKVGYKHAIQSLFDEYERLVKENPSDPETIEKMKSIREGIEYLCYPFREGLISQPISPTQDEDNPLTFSTIDNFTDEEIKEESRIYIQNKLAANKILLKLRSL